jgi:hypothetical protein
VPLSAVPLPHESNEVMLMLSGSDRLILKAPLCHVKLKEKPYGRGT